MHPNQPSSITHHSVSVVPASWDVITSASPPACADTACYPILMNAKMFKETIRN
jgi:hypothetical protein